MAFTNFYQDSGGNDMNAGSVVNAAASVTSTNGSWDITADTFIATGGTPFSAVTVGEWASIYVDGTTSGAVYVAQVTTINSGGLSITLSTTAKYGTKPASGATGKSCKVGGSWLTELPLTTITGTVPASTKINLKGNLTITASRTVALAGSTTAPLWFSAYTTTPGDLDADTTNALTKPIWTFNSTFQLTASGNHQVWSGLSIAGVRSGVLVTASGSPQKWSRIRVNNTSSNAAAACVSGGNNFWGYGWFTVPSTSTATIWLTTSNNAEAVGCVADGSGGTSSIAFDAATALAAFHQCIALNCGTGFNATTAAMRLTGCTTYACATNGVNWSGTPGAGASVIGCLFSGANGGTAMTNGVNNASGTNTNNVHRACNDYYNVTNTEVGMGDAPALFGQTDSSAVATSASNLTPVTGANARANGFPGIFENESFSSYPDIGAVRHIDPTRLFSYPGMAGGMSD